MINDTLLTPLETGVNYQPDNTQLFIGFINRLEGWKTKCKNLHWSAPKKNIHVYLDEFLSILSDYQDGLAEGYQGILGKMQPNAVKGIPSETLNALDFIAEVRKETISFYDGIHDTLKQCCPLGIWVQVPSGLLKYMWSDSNGSLLGS